MAVAQTIGEPQAFKFPMESERPQSALARGVQIREFKDLQVNPEPIVIEETELLLAEYLSPRRLRDITGVEDLGSVQALEIKVDTTDTSLGNFGTLLPNLRQLRLSNSCIASLRDLGSGFDQLMVLWLSRCCLEEIDGVATMCNLRELYLSYNEINDLSPCSMLDNLQILDLEGNNVDDVCQIEFLALCSSLRNLTLEGNPICLSPRPDVEFEPGYDYRAAICTSLPQLQILDDEPASQTSRSVKKGPSVFNDDWALINELIAEGEILTNEDSPSPAPLRPGSGTASRPLTGYRPGSALRPASGRRLASRRSDEFRPLSRAAGTAVRPGTALRPGTGRPGTGQWASPVSTAEAEDDASELTQGSVVCGNPSKALRARRKQRTNATPPTPKHEQLLSRYRKSSKTTPPPPSSAEVNPEEEQHLEELFEEVEGWKKLNLKSKQDRESQREAPQILRIDDHPFFTSDSDSESESENELSRLNDVTMGADDVVKDELAEAEDLFRLEMTRSKMMLRDYDNEEEEEEGGASQDMTSSTKGSGTGRLRARRYRPAHRPTHGSDPAHQTEHPSSPPHANSTSPRSTSVGVSTSSKPAPPVKFISPRPRSDSSDRSSSRPQTTRARQECR